MKLVDYMKREALGPDEMAAQVGDVSVSGVRKWMYGERVPRPDQMRRIAAVTGGAVMPNDFVMCSEAAE